MTPRTIVGLVCIGLLSITSPAWAGSKSIQGVVKGEDGKPLAGAEVRAERMDGKAPIAIAKTDAKGVYVFSGLAVGTYKITASVNKVPKSAASIRTRKDGWVRVNFDLRGTGKIAKKGKKKHYVWVKGEPGSHIGGRWVEEGEENQPSTSAVDTVGGDDVRRLQGNQGLHPMPGVKSGPGQ